MNSMELTEEQRDAMLKLGDTSAAQIILLEVLEQLTELGLVYERDSDGHIDFTDVGELVYEQLTNQ